MLKEDKKNRLDYMFSYWIYYLALHQRYWYQGNS